MGNSKHSNVCVILISFGLYAIPMLLIRYRALIICIRSKRIYILNVIFLVEVLLQNGNEDAKTLAIFKQPDIKILCSFTACLQTNLENPYLNKKIFQQKMENVGLAKMKANAQILSITSCHTTFKVITVVK